MDDVFFLVAVVTLLTGSALFYADVPYIYAQIDVSLGLIPPPADFIQQLLRSIKLQDAAAVLLTTAVFSVKFSFWLFFRSLLRRLYRLTIWWWCILPFLVVAAAFCMTTRSVEDSPSKKDTEDITR